MMYYEPPPPPYTFLSFKLIPSHFEHQGNYDHGLREVKKKTKHLDGFSPTHPKFGPPPPPNVDCFFLTIVLPFFSNF